MANQFGFNRAARRPSTTLSMALLTCLHLLRANCSQGLESKDVVGIWTFILPTEQLKPEERAQLPGEIKMTVDIWPDGDGLGGAMISLDAIVPLASASLAKNMLSVALQNAEGKQSSKGSGPIDDKMIWTPKFDYESAIEGGWPGYKFVHSPYPSGKDVSAEELTGEFRGKLSAAALLRPDKKETVDVVFNLAITEESAGGKVKLTPAAGPSVEYPLRLFRRYHNRIYFEWEEPSNREGRRMGRFLGDARPGRLEGCLNTRWGAGKCQVAKQSEKVPGSERK